MKKKLNKKAIITIAAVVILAAAAVAVYAMQDSENKEAKTREDALAVASEINVDDYFTEDKKAVQALIDEYTKTIADAKVDDIKSLKSEFEKSIEQYTTKEQAIATYTEEVCKQVGKDNEDKAKKIIKDYKKQLEDATSLADFKKVTEDIDKKVSEATKKEVSAAKTTETTKDHTTPIQSGSNSGASQGGTTTSSQSASSGSYQPSTGGSGGGSSHTHNWQPIYATRTVTDYIEQQRGTGIWQYYCNTCGAAITSGSEHEDTTGCPCNSTHAEEIFETVQVPYPYEEQYVSGYSCYCGARK